MERGLMYPIMTYFIDRMQKDDLKKNLMAFFIRLDEAMGEGKAISKFVGRLPCISGILLHKRLLIMVRQFCYIA